MSETTTMWTAIAALGATTSALFAAAYTYLTYRLLRAQKDPHVVVYVSHDRSRATVLMLVIENTGSGVASDVRFDLSRPVPESAFGIEKLADAPRTMTDGPLIDGIPTLGPGDSRRITWGQYGGLKDSIGTEPIEVTCHFKRGKRRLPPTVSYLEVLSFGMTDATSSEGARLIKEVEKIAKGVDALKTVIERRLSQS